MSYDKEIQLKFKARYQNKLQSVGIIDPDTFCYTVYRLIPWTFGYRALYNCTLYYQQEKTKQK